MGNVITVKKETKIGKLKKMIRTLEQHRRAINFKVSRITRELKITEGKLRKSITRSTIDGGRTRYSARMHDSSTQVRIVFMSLLRGGEKSLIPNDTAGTGNRLQTQPGARPEQDPVQDQLDARDGECCRRGVVGVRD